MQVHYRHHQEGPLRLLYHHHPKVVDIHRITTTNHNMIPMTDHYNHRHNLTGVVGAVVVVVIMHAPCVTIVETAMNLLVDMDVPIQTTITIPILLPTATCIPTIIPRLRQICTMIHPRPFPTNGA